MSPRRAPARLLLAVAALSLLATACRAEFDVERDIAAAGNESLVAEAASDSSRFDSGESPEDSPADGDNEDGDNEDGFELDLDGSGGSFSFEASSDLDAGGEGVIPTGPGTEPNRDMSWNTDRDSVLEHLASIAPADGRLRFEWKTVSISDEELVTGPFPVGWEISQPFLGIDLEPGDGYDFFTDAEIDAGCQGSCVPKDWAAVMDDPELSPFLGNPDATTVVLQDLSPIPGEAPGGRMLVITDPESAFSPAEVTVTRWSDDASHFLWCAVDLDEEDVDLWPVMADMCAAMRPDWMS